MADTDDDAAGGDEDEKGLPPKDAKKDAKKKHRDNMLLIGVAVVGVILTFLIYRSNKAKASSSTSSTTSSALPTTAGYPLGGSSGDPYTQQALGSISDQLGQQTSALQGLVAAINNMGTGAGQSLQASPPAGTPAASAPPATPGYGYINLPGIGQSVILGELSPGGYSGYQVGGGAPVYFGNANAVSQGTGQETASNYAYTPVGFASLVSPTASSGGPLPGQH